MNKKYIWCFMGQVHAQGARAEMIDALKKLEVSITAMLILLGNPAIR